MIVIPTMAQWWELTKLFPSYQYVTDRILKDYGYLAILKYLKTHSPTRILEFGYGFNPTVFEVLEQREDVEVWGVDDYQGLHYFPEKNEWDARHKNELVDRFPRTRFVRGLLGMDSPTRQMLPENYFDFICSVSVLEEVPVSKVQDILAHCRRLLRPGGVMLNTHDICLAQWHRVGAFLKAHRAVGFPLDITPEEESKIVDEKQMDLSRVIIQNPAKIMINRKKNRGEDAAYPGHWTTLCVSVTKEQ